MERDGGELDRVQSLPAFADNFPTISTHDIGDDTREKVAGDHMFPDGGFEAWLQVVGGFLAALNTWFGHMNGSQCVLGANANV